jgi:hypothetical protein
MRRRELITLLGGAVAVWPLATRAQQPARYRVGHLAIAAPTDTPPPPPANWDAFVRGLREAGYIEGQNVAFEHRSAHDLPELFPKLALELAALNVDVIFARGTWALAAAKSISLQCGQRRRSFGGPRQSSRHRSSCVVPGSPHLSAISRQTLAISVRTSNTTRSMLRRTARSPRGAHRAGRLDSAVNVTLAIPSIISSTSARRTSSRFFSIRRNRNISVLAATSAASASVRGDCCRSRRRNRK